VVVVVVCYQGKVYSLYFHGTVYILWLSQRIVRKLGVDMDLIRVHIKLWQFLRQLVGGYGFYPP
jgi:ABC-type glycerol-3-phosphate transport system substrate-binding protein